MEKLQQLLQRVEEVPETRKQKLLNWDLGMMGLPISWVKTTLEAMATRYQKRWSGLARAADPSRLYLPKMEGGLQLPPLSLLYKSILSMVKLAASDAASVRMLPT